MRAGETRAGAATVLARSLRFESAPPQQVGPAAADHHGKGGCGCGEPTAPSAPPLAALALEAPLAAPARAASGAAGPRRRSQRSLKRGTSDAAASQRA